MKSNTFWVESKDAEGNVKIVAHSYDKGEMHYQFLSRAQANKLLKDERKAAPTLMYRVVRKVTQIFHTKWE